MRTMTAFETALCVAMLACSAAIFVVMGFASIGYQPIVAVIRAVGG